MKVISNVNLVPFIQKVVTNKTDMKKYILGYLHTTANFIKVLNNQNLFIIDLKSNHTIIQSIIRMLKIFLIGIKMIIARKHLVMQTYVKQ